MEFNNLVIKGKGELNKIKSKYIIAIIFNHLNGKKLLDIIKYNKNIKKRIDININHYKDFSEKYSSIEIEIKPVKHKYNKFINIKREEKEYYHIYFNNNKEEALRDYINEDEEINMIKIKIDYQVK